MLKIIMHTGHEYMLIMQNYRNFVDITLICMYDHNIWLAWCLYQCRFIIS
jgi:hypothetical protein